MPSCWLSHRGSDREATSWRDAAGAWFGAESGSLGRNGARHWEEACGQNQLTNLCGGVTPAGRANGERILVTAPGLAATVSLKPRSSVSSGSTGPVVGEPPEGGEVAVDRALHRGGDDLVTLGHENAVEAVGGTVVKIA